MYSLHESQSHLATTLEKGPSACPDDLFENTLDHVLRALKVHANTISHGRLLALEDSFPLTRGAMGDELFNNLTREFLGAGHDCALPLSRVGEGLADWFKTNAVSRSWVALARFEWLWLECYHSADAVPLFQADFSGLDEAGLLAMVVMVHPTVRVVGAGDGLAAAIGIVSDHSTLLVVRPEDMVLVHPVNADVVGLVNVFRVSQSLASGFETFLTFNPNADAMQCMETLLAIGALTKETMKC